MANPLRSLTAAIACAPCLILAQAAPPDGNAGVGDMLLQPSTITISGHFEISPGPTTLELAIRSIGQQIDKKRTEEAARSPLEPFWKSPVWKLLPADPGGTLNSPVSSLPDRLARNPLYLDDPYCTPAYLTLKYQQLEREVAFSDKRTLWFFGR